mmetsp:Transcript_89078/g.154270  ORF Transcript_89078/g.154270 Transcript_89078/m.154270 type:complete len:235 (+) Transcript_89078:60-764(+)
MPVPHGLRAPQVRPNLRLSEGHRCVNEVRTGVSRGPRRFCGTVVGALLLLLALPEGVPRPPAGVPGVPALIPPANGVLAPLAPGVPMRPGVPAPLKGRPRCGVAGAAEGGGGGGVQRPAAEGRPRVVLPEGGRTSTGAEALCETGRTSGSLSSERLTPPHSLGPLSVLPGASAEVLLHVVNGGGDGAVGVEVPALLFEALVVPTRARRSLAAAASTCNRYWRVHGDSCPGRLEL